MNPPSWRDWHGVVHELPWHSRTTRCGLGGMNYDSIVRPITCFWCLCRVAIHR